MLGAIIGDIVGSTREWNNVKTTDFELLPPGSRFTDDTVMTLAVAEWLMTDPDHKPQTLVECMQTLGRRYPAAGYGGGFSRWLATDNPLPYNSFGNGSAMRVSPVGLYAKSLDEALELAAITASVSHNHPEGVKGAQAIAAAVFLRHNADKYKFVDIKEYIETHFGYNLDADLDKLRDSYTFDVSCQGSVPEAIMAFLKHPADAEKALRLAISLGGDSDTIAAMTCSIWCALPDGDYPYMKFLPEWVEERCRALLPSDLLDINDRFESFINDRKVEIAEDIRDSIRGCLIAGAAGDALGYAVEFMRRAQILKSYGKDGITEFDLNSENRAEISDDTQMTLFTANGILMGMTRCSMRGIGAPVETYVGGAYIDWYYTQTGEKGDTFGDDFHYTWLRDLPQLHKWRAPGNTCLDACRALLNHREVKNNSKGCGGIMRVAPIALVAASYKFMGVNFYKPARLAQAGAEIARATHKHPLGFLPAAMLTRLVYNLVPLSPREASARFDALVADAVAGLDEIYLGEFAADKALLAELTHRAMSLARSDVDDAEAIRRLGEGWTGEEAWAIAVYCAARHLDSVSAALIAAVNHDGDSDSTGSVCGNIMGAIYGYEALKNSRIFCPEGKSLEEVLELHDIILAIADDLYTGCIIGEYSPLDTPEQRQWYERYCKMQPAGL